MVSLKSVFYNLVCLSFGADHGRISLTLRIICLRRGRRAAHSNTGPWSGRLRRKFRHILIRKWLGGCWITNWLQRLENGTTPPEIVRGSRQDNRALARTAESLLNRVHKTAAFKLSTLTSTRYASADRGQERYSIVFGYELSTLQWRLIVVFIFSRAFRQLDLILRNFLVWDLSKDV